MRKFLSLLTTFCLLSVLGIKADNYRSDDANLLYAMLKQMVKDRKINC